MSQQPLEGRSGLAKQPDAAIASSQILRPIGPMVASTTVRLLAIGIAAWTAGVAIAHADAREDLQAKGEAFARDGHWSEAIEQFKAADKIEPRASHACLIALAYTRKEAWPQAELFLALCHERSTVSSEALPDWVPVADQQIRERLQAAKLVEVSIEIKPATVRATLTVSSFAPDEVFSPRTIHLPAGTHVIVARAQGFPDVKQVLEITDEQPRHVVLDFAPLVAAQHAPAPHPGRTLMIAGGATIGLGVAAHIWMAFERAKLQQAADDHAPLAWDRYSTKFDVAKYSALGLYAVGAGILVTGYLIHRSHRGSHVEVGAAPLSDGGGFVTLGWTP